MQVDGGKVRLEEGRHSGLFSFIRRNSLGDKKPLATVHQMVTASESALVVPPANSRQNNDGNLELL